MLAQLLRPLRGHCNRFIATSVGTKSTGDNEQHHHVFAGSDVAFIEPEPATTLCEMRDEEKPKLMGRFSRWLSSAIGTKLATAVENEPNHMFAPGDNTFDTPEPSPRFHADSVRFDGVANNGVANLPVMWPMQSVFNSNGEGPSWVDMRLYQAPVAAYQQAEAVTQEVPNGYFPSAAVLMQPVIMPIFYPYAAMQMPMGTEANTTFTVNAAQADTQQHEAPVDPPQGPRHRRSRRGGAAVRKKNAAAAAAAAEDVVVQETTQACSTTAQGPSDPEAKDDVQSLSTEVGTPKSADVDSTTDSSVHCEAVLDGTTPSCEEAPTKSAPLDTADSTDYVDPMLVELDSTDEKRREFAFDWVSKSFWPLALTKRGCRILQKAIDAGTPVYQQQLLEHMRGQVQEAMQSPHANHVLQKFIEIMPAERMQFVLSELQDQVLRVARHRFGCRVLQRLVEHCAPQQTEKVIDTVLGDAASLCRHQYGNYVLQHILQHGSPSQRSAIADVVQQDIIRLSKHRVASHVVSSAMVHCRAEDVQRLTQSVLHDAGQLAELSRREYGSFVVREVNRAARLLRDEQ